LMGKWQQVMREKEQAVVDSFVPKLDALYTQICDKTEEHVVRKNQLPSICILNAAASIPSGTGYVFIRVETDLYEFLRDRRTLLEDDVKRIVGCKVSFNWERCRDSLVLLIKYMHVPQNVIGLVL